MIAVAFVAAAAAGGIVRWQISRLNRPGMPAGTFVVNVVASFVAGLVVGLSADLGTIVAVGTLGSASTFSTFVAEIDDLRRDHGRARSALYVVLTCAVGIGAAALGLAMAD